ncbi:DUF433 domain-containing protein [Terricaulis silvestris]|uniref:DUF433 domain-containing protein n=1 Tax=Terricaulis silvestris TaxID=2686094 RepID=UPI00131D0847
MTLLDRITVEPGKMNGRPCVRGMRIRVIDVLASGVTNEDILRDYPCLEADDLRACVAYASKQLGSSVEVR